MRGSWRHFLRNYRNWQRLRLENPELSLKELGELLSEPIGRSGVNHRFQKIAAFAEG
ncbi:MAG: helix-turn-helix domain-containing protein [Ruminococcus callidus]